jgi:succinate dehydrogenase (ubiquinone) cytochrome b560 subunit
MMSQSLPGLRRTGIIILREMRTRFGSLLLTSNIIIFSAIKRSEAETPIQKFGFEYLKKQTSSHRPLSPHLTIYKPQLTWMLSGAHRVSGCLMAGSKLFLAFSCSISTI